jgi:protein ImuB
MRWIALQAIACEAGSEACVKAGFSVAQAPSIKPAVLNGAALQRAISAIALGFTPRVALLDEAVLMEVSGSLRLFGGLRKLAALLEQDLHPFLLLNTAKAKLIRAQGATSLIAIARLRLLARQLSLPNRIGDLPSRVGDLPMHTLSAARPHVPVLERTGCQSWDDLLRLPRDGVVRRFGAPLLDALDRARGVLPDSYTWLQLPEQFDEKLELDALVVHAPALMAGVLPLLAHLQAWLLGRQSGLQALKLTWYLDKRRDGPTTGELVIRTANSAQDLRHVVRLVTERLNQQALPAPVHSIRLQSLMTEKLQDSKHATTSLLPEEKQIGDSAQQLMERLSARLGSAQVQTWQSCADHRPEHMQRWNDAIDNIDALNATKSGAVRLSNNWDKGINDPQNRLENGVLYPSWLLPEPLKLVLVAGSPVYQGALVRLAGPQRLEATGWHAANAGATPSPVPPAIRDYFIYRSQRAGLLWIYSERGALPASTTSNTLQQWYLHGFFA